jgi:hypothetical protein
MVLAPHFSKSASVWVFSPVSSAITVVIDATPITIPVVVRIERVFFAHI